LPAKPVAKTQRLSANQPNPEVVQATDRFRLSGNPESLLPDNLDQRESNTIAVIANPRQTRRLFPMAEGFLPEPPLWSYPYDQLLICRYNFIHNTSVIEDFF
jgi:hypothetical protein